MFINCDNVRLAKALYIIKRADVSMFSVSITIICFHYVRRLKLANMDLGYTCTIFIGRYNRVTNDCTF